MPRRLTPLVTSQYYHVFNRGVNKQPIFNKKRDYIRAIETLNFYLFSDTPVRYSKFFKLPKEQREKLSKEMKDKVKLCDIIAYCLMPNHFHFLLRQNVDDGIFDFIRHFQISYNMFFNKRYDRVGPLLQGQFKAVLIEDDEQLLHLSRYIHLNPYTSYLVSNFNRLISYPWSSFGEYLGERDGLCNKKIILSNFRGREDYKKFVFNNKDYQRELREIKHLLLE